MEKNIQDLNKAGYSVSTLNNRILIKSNQLTIIGKSNNTLWTAADVLCNECYGFASNQSYIAIDIGQNIGITSLYYAMQDNIKHIYGFEPFKPSFIQGQVNIKNNPNLSDKISSFNYGLSGKNTEMELHYNSSRPGSMSTSFDRFNDGPLENVIIRDASEVLEPILSKCSEKVLCKIDCEGSEGEILSSFEVSKLINKINIFLIEWHFFIPQALIDLLLRNNFVVFYEHVVRNELGFIRAVRM